MKTSSKKRSYADKLIWQNRIMKGTIILMLIYLVVISELGLGNSRVETGFARDVSIAIFFGGIIYLLVRIRRNKTTLGSWRLLRQEQELERDELKHAIHEKTGGVCWDIMLIWQLIVTFTASLWNMEAFYASIATLAVLVFVKVGLTLYVRIAGVE